MNKYINTNRKSFCADTLSIKVGVHLLGGAVDTPPIWVSRSFLHFSEDWNTSKFSGYLQFHAQKKRVYVKHLSHFIFKF